MRGRNERVRMCLMAYKEKKASEKASESEKEIEREKRDVVCFRGKKSVKR